MKKFLAAIAPTILLAFSASPAFAVYTGIGSACPGNGFIGLCLTADQLGRVVGSFITLVFVFVGLIALGYLIFGGFKWLTSQGEKSEVENSRNHIVAAIIGIIIIFLSYLAVNLLLNFLTGGKVNLTNLAIPSIGQP